MTDALLAGAPHLRAQLEQARAAKEQQGLAAGFARGVRRAQQESAKREQARAVEHAAILEASRASAATALSALEAAIDRVNQVEVRRLEEVDDMLLSAAFDLAELLVERELSDTTRSSELAALRAARLNEEEQGITELLFNPSDLASLNASSIAGVPARGAAHIQPGDVEATVNHGRLVASTSRRVEILKARFSRVSKGVGE